MNSTFCEILKISNEIEKENIFLADKLESGFFQYNWETLVELFVCDKEEGLIPYGDGADFYDLSSRVTFKSKRALKQIKVHISNSSYEYISENKISNSIFEFNKLVNFKNGCYYTESPFNYVHCENEKGDIFIFKLNEVDFILENLES